MGVEALGPDSVSFDEVVRGGEVGEEGGWRLILITVEKECFFVVMGGEEGNGDADKVG